MCPELCPITVNVINNINAKLIKINTMHQVHCIVKIADPANLVPKFFLS